MFSVRVGFQPGRWDNPAGPAGQPPAGRTFLRRNRLRNGLKSLGATVKRGNSGASVSAGPPQGCCTVLTAPSTRTERCAPSTAAHWQGLPSAGHVLPLGQELPLPCPHRTNDHHCGRCHIMWKQEKCVSRTLLWSTSISIRLKNHLMRSWKHFCAHLCIIFQNFSFHDQVTIVQFIFCSFLRAMPSKMPKSYTHLMEMHQL